MCIVKTVYFKDDFKDFWLKFKSICLTLFNEAIKVNTMCATSVACESCFSIAGYIQRKQRNKLSNDSLRYQLISKQHKKILEIEKNME